MATIFSQIVLLGILVVTAFTLFRLGQWKEKFINHDKYADKINSIHDRLISVETKVQFICDHINLNPTPDIDEHDPTKGNNYRYTTYQEKKNR